MRDHYAFLKIVMDSSIISLKGKIMDTLISIFLGVITGLFVSKARYRKLWDILIGIVGALGGYAAVASMNVGYNPYALALIMAGGVVIIHFSRFLRNLPQV